MLCISGRCPAVLLHDIALLLSAPGAALELTIGLIVGLDGKALGGLSVVASLLLGLAWAGPEAGEGPSAASALSTWTNASSGSSLFPRLPPLGDAEELLGFPLVAAVRLSARCALSFSLCLARLSAKSSFFSILPMQRGGEGIIWGLL